ncbi:hypothetical protein ACE1SV_15130 [Streptomyces sp. E-15]
MASRAAGGPVRWRRARGGTAGAGALRVAVPGTPVCGGFAAGPRTGGPAGCAAPPAPALAPSRRPAAPRHRGTAARRGRYRSRTPSTRRGSPSGLSSRSSAGSSAVGAFW